MNALTPQIALTAAAIVVGVLLDRLILSHRATASGDNAIVAPAAPEVAPSNATTVSNSAPVVMKRKAETASGGRPGLDGILAEHDPRQRTRDLQAYVNALQPREYADALKRMKQIAGSNERELASRLLVAQWVATDPEGALQFAAANRGYEYLADDVFQQRAATDFQSALAQPQEIPGNDLRYRALRGVLSFRADTDPAGAIQLAQTFGQFPGNEPLGSALYRQWAGFDPQGAAAYASAQQGQGGGGWRSPINQVVSTWAQQDPVAAANWSLSLSDSEAQLRSLSQVMRDWGRQDPTGTANWIHTLPAGVQHDTAVAGFAESMAFADPQNALNWIGTITDDAVRQRALQARVDGWQKTVETVAVNRYLGTATTGISVLAGTSSNSGAWSVPPCAAAESARLRHRHVRLQGRHRSSGYRVVPPG
jgi:hypothetical protein